MKRFYLYFYSLLALVVVALSGPAANARVTISETATEIRYDITVDDVKFADTEIAGQNFTAASLAGVDGYEAVLYQEGAPAVPVVRLLVNGINPQVEAGAIEALQTAKTLQPLAPVQPSRLKIRGLKTPFVKSAQLYNKNGAYPSGAYSVSQDGTVRGVPRQLITLHPLRFNPATKSYEFQRNFSVTVQKQRAYGANVRQDVFVFLVGPTFLNSDALNRYVEFKRGMGYSTRVIRGEQVANADAIRQTLQSIYRESKGGLKYALIIGDNQEVPGKDSNIINGVTDHFYRAIDTDNYTADINGPDIGVGRFSAANEEQLAAMVDKAIAYQTGQFAQERWLEGAAFLATDDRYQVAEGSHNYAIDNYTAPAGYWGIFPEANQPGGDKLYAITHRVPNDKVQEVLQEGRTIINYSGHGARTYWDAPSVKQSDVRAMQDPSALPFVISNACITGDFRIDESFGETWQRHRYGAIFFWGSMDNTYWDEDDILEKRMYDGIYDLKRSTFSEITQYSLSEHWRHYGGEGKAAYYWETYVSFGDPSIHLRTQLSSAVKIEGLMEAPIGLRPLNYTLTNYKGDPVVNARVAFVNGYDSHVAYTNDRGVVEFMPPDHVTPGTTYNIVVEGRNLRMNTNQVRLISPDQPYINLKDMLVNSRIPLGVGAGETFDLSFQVGNVGMVDTQGGELTVVSWEGPIEPLRDRFRIPALEAGQYLGAGDELMRFHVSPDAMSGDLVKINFRWEVAEGIEGFTSASFTVARGVLEVTGIDFGTAGANDVGGISPGSSGTVFLTVRNTGNEAIGNAKLQPEGMACVSSISGDIEIAALDAGAEMRIAAPINVGVMSSCANGDNVGIRLVGDYDGYGGITGLETTGVFPAGIVSTRNLEFGNINMPIPDDAEAVQFTMDVEQGGILTDIAVHVRITHTYIGDLVVTLVHPSGQEVTLHSRAGGSSNDLDVVYGMDGELVPGLRELAGQSVTGAWKIKVQDTAGSDTGTLDFVGLKLKGYLQ